MMMADVFQAMAVLGVIETLVLYLPTTLGHVIERTTADCSHRGIGEPEGFNHLAVRLVLSVEDDPYGLPTQSVPRIEVVGVPELDLIRSVPKGNCGRLGGKSFLRSGQQFGQVRFQARHDRQAQIADGMQKGSVVESPIDHDVIGKTDAEFVDGPAQQALGAGVFAIARPVGFYIDGKGQSGPYYADQDQVMRYPTISSSALRNGRHSGQLDLVQRPTVVPSRASPMKPLLWKALLRLA